MGKLDEIVQLVEQGDVERALALAEQVKQNGSDEERYMLADYLFSWGFLEEAEALVHLLLARYPDERELQLFLAEIYTEMDKEEEALELLIDIEEDDPYYVRACLLMADLYQMQGLNEVSEQKLLKAYEKMPNEPLVQFALAELYFTSGQYEKSLPYYEQVMKQTKTMAGTVLAQRMAEAYSLLGEFEQAMVYYEQALNERFDAHTLFQYGFTAYQAEAYKTAIAKLSELKALDREYVPLYLFLAKSYEQEGDIQQSYEIAKEGLAIDEWNKELLVYAGKIALKLGKRKEAIEYIEQALHIDPGYLEALFIQTSLLFHEERYEDVVRIIQQALDQGEYDPQFEWELAKAKQKLEMYDQALNHYEEAYTFFKDDPNFLYDFGYFLFEEGRREKAKDIFEQLLRIDPTNEEIAHMMLQFE